jgi:hypothetical protein
MRFWLLLNAALYALFAVWCTVTPSRTAAAIGYVGLSAGGRSEYLTLYGGLQLGLAAMFLTFALDPALLPGGIAVAVMLYTPIVLYRWITITIYRPAAGITLAVAVLETILLIGSLYLYWRT